MDDQSQQQQDQAGVKTAKKSSEKSKDSFLKYKDADITPELQQTLNSPLQRQGGIDEKDAEFLNLLMIKIDKNEINLYRPGTLLNLSVYDKLASEGKGKADFDAVNLLTTIREIRKLWNAGHRDTYQIENLTHQLRLIKERLEKISGDIYII